MDGNKCYFLETEDEVVAEGEGSLQVKRYDSMLFDCPTRFFKSGWR